MAQWFAFVVVPDCKAKSSRGRVQFQILWKIWGKGEQRDCGLIVDFQLWILLKIQRGMILTWLTSCYCSAFEIFLKPHKQRRFPRSGHLRIGALRQQPPSLGFKSKQFALSILSSSLQGGEHFKRGRMQGWSFILVLCKSPRPQRSFCSHLKGEPCWQASVSSPPRLSPHVTSSSRPATDGRWAGWWGTPPSPSVALSHPRSWGLQIYSSSTFLCFEQLHSKCWLYYGGFQDKGTMKNTICLDLATFLRAVQGCYDIVLFIKQCLINTENEECIVFQLNWLNLIDKFMLRPHSQDSTLSCVYKNQLKVVFILDSSSIKLKLHNVN